MLWTIIIILTFLWVAGMIAGITLGGFIHLLILLAVILIIVRVILGRRPV